MFECEDTGSKTDSLPTSSRHTMQDLLLSHEEPYCQILHKPNIFITRFSAEFVSQSIHRTKSKSQNFNYICKMAILCGNSSLDHELNEILVLLSKLNLTN